MKERVRTCWWKDGALVVETDRTTYRLSSTLGMKSLKNNRISAADLDELTDDLIPFPDDSPRRMALIQEQLSGIKD